MKRYLPILIILIGILTFPFLLSSSYNVQYLCSNGSDSGHYWELGSTNNFIFCADQQYIYANVISNLGTQVNFTKASFASSQNPSYTFGLNATGGNTTLQQINNQNIVLLNKGSPNDSFFYPSGYGVPIEIDVGSMKIFRSSFITSFSTWKTTSGPSVYSNTAKDYITVNAGTSGATITILFSGVEISITLNHANQGPALASPDYIDINYTISGVGKTIQAEDGTYVFAADAYSLITVNGISGNPTTTMRFCLASCSTVFDSITTQGQVLTYNYWTQYLTTVSYSAPDTFVSNIQQNPYFVFTSGGVTTPKNSQYLLTTTATYWVDEGTNVNPQQLWFNNGHLYSPTPTTFSVTSSSSVIFAYSLGGTVANCQGNTNTTFLWQNQCYAPAVFWTFATPMTPAVFMGAIEALVVLPILIGKKNVLLSLAVGIIAGGAMASMTGYLAVQEEILLWLGITAATTFIFLAMYLGRSQV